MSLLLDALRKAEQALHDAESESDSINLPESVPAESAEEEPTYSAVDSDLEQNSDTSLDLKLEESLSIATPETSEFSLDEDLEPVLSSDVELSLDKKTLDDAVAQSTDENFTLDIEDTVFSEPATNNEGSPTTEAIIPALTVAPADNHSDFDDEPAFRSVIFDDGTPYSERNTENNYRRPAIAFVATLGLAGLFTYIYLGLEQAKNNETTQANTTLAKAYNPTYQAKNKLLAIKNSLKTVDKTLSQRAAAAIDKLSTPRTSTDSKVDSRVKAVIGTSEKNPFNPAQSVSVEPKATIQAHNEHSTSANDKMTDKPIAQTHSETNATVNLVNKANSGPTETPKNQQGSSRKIIHIKKSGLAEPVTQDLVEAFRLYHARQWLKARTLYQKVLVLDNKNRDALLGLAAIAIKQKNYSLASGYYQSLLKIDPKDSAALTGLMASGSQTANVRSIAYIKQVIRNNPRSAHLHFSLGNMYATRGRWVEAQNAYFTAYRLDSANAIYVLNLAISLDQLGQSKTALSYYHQTLRLKRNKIPYANRKTVKKRIKELEKNRLSYTGQSQTRNRTSDRRH